jgi:HEAT repeat protein
MKNRGFMRHHRPGKARLRPSCVIMIAMPADGERVSEKSDDRLKKLSGDLQEAIARGDVTYLLEAMQDAPFELRVAAVEGLTELGGEQARMALSRIARDRWGERPELRIAALRSLGRITEPHRYISLLDEFIAQDNRKVVAAARGMLRGLDPEGYPRRLAGRGCVDHGAIRAYGDSREESALPLLGGYLGNLMETGQVTSTRQWGKVHAAVKSLGNIGGGDSVQILERLLEWLEEEAQTVSTGLNAQRLAKIRHAAERAMQAAKKG